MSGGARWRTRIAGAVAVAAAMSIMATAAAAQTASNGSSTSNAASSERSNGIGVGVVKLFDERLLSSMLQQLENQLVGITAINGTTVNAAVGNTSGARATSSQFALSVNGLPTPEQTSTKTAQTGTESTTESSQGSTTTTGKETTTQDTSSLKGTDKSTGSSTNTDTVTNKAVTPQAPALPQGTNLYSSGPAVSLEAQNLLNQQINLSAQIMNLRLLLTRAVSDRFLIFGRPDEHQATLTSAQAVLGFQISIDARKIYRDAVAEVEISLGKAQAVGSCDFHRDAPPTLSLMLPREKSYNVATISKSANSIGFGAIVQVVNVGFSMSKSSESMYMVQDYDTVALERTATADKTVFAWQFRPTLGRSNVEPGPRDVFALVSLPAPSACNLQVPVETRTHWYKYDKKSGSIGDEINGSANEITRRFLDVPNYEAQENALRPKILWPVRWIDSGNGTIIGWLDGEAYLPGTEIILGDRVFSPADGSVVVQGDNRLRFSLPAQKLAQSRDAMLVGSFGTPIPVRRPSASGDTDESRVVNDGFVLADASFESVDADRALVKIELTHRKFAPGPYRPDRPVVSIGDHLFGLSDAPIVITEDTGLHGAKANATLLQFHAPLTLLASAEKAIVIEFFKGPNFWTEVPISVQSAFTATKAEIIAANKVHTTIGIVGSRMTKDTVVDVNGATYSDGHNGARLIGSTLLVLTLPNDQLSTAKRFLITKGDAAPIMLPPPGGPAKPSAPTATLQDTVHPHDSIWAVVNGSGLDDVADIVFENTVHLAFRPGDKPDTLRVWLTDEVTKTEGTKDLLLVTRNGTATSLRFKVSKLKGERRTD